MLNFNYSDLAVMALAAWTIVRPISLRERRSAMSKWDQRHGGANE